MDMERRSPATFSVTSQEATTAGAPPETIHFESPTSVRSPGRWRHGDGNFIRDLERGLEGVLSEYDSADSEERAAQRQIVVVPEKYHLGWTVNELKAAERAFHDELIRRGGRPYYSIDMLDRIAKRPQDFPQEIDVWIRWKRDREDLAPKWSPGRWCTFESQIRLWEEFRTRQRDIRGMPDTPEVYEDVVALEELLDDPLHMKHQQMHQDRIANNWSREQMIADRNRQWMAAYDDRERPQGTFDEWAERVKKELDDHAFEHMEFSTLSLDLASQHPMTTWAEFLAWAWIESDKTEFDEALSTIYRSQTTYLRGRLINHPDLEIAAHGMHMWRMRGTTIANHAELLEMLRGQMAQDQPRHNYLKYTLIPDLQRRIPNKIYDEDERAAMQDQLEEARRELLGLIVNLKKLRYTIKLTVRIVKRERMTANSVAYRRHRFDLAWWIEKQVTEMRFEMRVGGRRSRRIAANESFSGRVSYTHALARRSNKRKVRRRRQLAE